jgi:uncharacterized protein with beta-barrel porin domain
LGKRVGKVGVTLASACLVCLCQPADTNAADWDYSAVSSISAGTRYENIKNFDGGDTLNITVNSSGIGQGTSHGNLTSPFKIFDTTGNEVSRNDIRNVNIDLHTVANDFVGLHFGADADNTNAGSDSWTVKEGDTFTVVDNGGSFWAYFQIGGEADYNSNNGGDGHFTVNGGTVKFDDDVDFYIGGYGENGGNGTFTMTGGNVELNGTYLYLADDARTTPGVGTFDMSGGTFKLTNGRMLGDYFTLTGGNLILDNATIFSPQTDPEVAFNKKIDIGANARVTFRGQDHAVDADQINIAAGSTFAFDVSSSSLSAGNTAPAVTLTANSPGTLGKFNIKLQETSSSTAGTYYLISAPGVNLTGKVNDIVANNRLGLDATTNATNEKVEVTVTYTSGNVDNTPKVATWNSTDANATWGENAWDLSGGSSSRFFKDDDQVEFKNGNKEEVKNITVGSSGVTVAKVGASDHAMLVDSKADYTFEGGTITVTNGDVKKANAGTLTIKNEIDLSSNSTGKVELTAGETVLSGKITLTGTNAVTVGNGATLSGGNGGIDVISGNLLFKNGSIHRPGHSPGTFQTSGTIEYEPGAKIYIDFGKTAATTDLIKSDDYIKFAKNDGVVSVLVGNSGDLYVDDLASTQIIFESTGSGKIQLGSNDITVGDTSVGNDGKITIAAGNHKIVIENEYELDLEKATVGAGSQTLSLTAKGTIVPLPTDVTPNQLAVYESLDHSSLGSFANQLQYDLHNQPVAERKAALEALLPTVNSALFVATQRNVVTANRSIYNRLHSLQNRPVRYANNSLPRPIMLGQSCDPCEPVSCEQVECDPCDPCNSFGGFGNCSIADAWFEGFGDFLRQSSTNTLQGYRANTGGFNLGIDKRYSRNTILGIGFGSAYADIKTNDHSQWGDVEQYVFSVYGSRSWDDLTFSFSSGYAYSDYKLTRNPGAAKVTSKHDGDQYFAAFELAKKTRFGRYEMTPFYAIDFIRLEEGAYNEYTTGHNAAARIDAQNSNSYLQTLGVRFGRAKKWNGWLVKPVVTAGWVHDYGSGNIYTTAQYTGSGSKFTIKGASVNKNRALVGINLNIVTSPNVTVYGGYNGEFADQFQVQTAQIGLNYSF